MGFDGQLKVGKNWMDELTVEGLTFQICLINLYAGLTIAMK